MKKDTFVKVVTCTKHPQVEGLKGYVLQQYDDGMYSVVFPRETVEETGVMIAIAEKVRKVVKRNGIKG